MCASIFMRIVDRRTSGPNYLGGYKPQTGNARVLQVYFPSPAIFKFQKFFFSFNCAGEIDLKSCTYYEALNYS